MGTVVFKISDNIKDKVSDFYEEYKRDKTPPYSVFQAKVDDTVITLYTSGKIMFQGPSADIEANLWASLESNVNGKTIDISDSKDSKKKDDTTSKTISGKYMYKTTIGSDEVGTGDVFGPIIVTSSFVKKEDVEYLQEIGVCDSKKITDSKILEITPLIIKKVKYYSTMISNEEYNNTHSSDFNMNKIKAVMHDKVLKRAKEENPDVDYIVIDQFVNSRKYYEYLSGASPLYGITFLTKAESQVMSVAVSSIISRYLFLKEMDKISKIVGFEVLKGANNLVYAQVKKVYDTYGSEMLNKVCKMNFKGIDEIIKKP